MHWGDADGYCYRSRRYRAWRNGSWKLLRLRRFVKFREGQRGISGSWGGRGRETLGLLDHLDHLHWVVGQGEYS